MSELKRSHPRFLNSAEVQLVLEDGSTRKAWMTDISKGGLFVKTSEPPPVSSRVEVSMPGPDGRLTLTVSVMHVVDEATAARTGRERGAGLQFVDLDPEAKKGLDRYVDEIANRRETRAMSAIERAGQAMDLMSKVKTLLDGLGAEDLYAAVSSSPNASAEEIAKKTKELGKIFDEIPETLTAAQKGRVDMAKDALRRVAPLLNDPERRADYDRRHGHRH